jgi:DNA-binding GntR family transcriptional regulator
VITPQPGGSIYEQLAARLRADILTGRLQPGQRLPSERDLEQTYGIARLTVRRAIAVLRAEGLVVARHGHGVLVRDLHEPQDLTPPADATVTARMPTADERHAHALDEGVPVFVVTATDGAVEVFPADRWQLRWPTA